MIKILLGILFSLMITVQMCPAASHEVDLAWTASVDAGVTYNIYRAAGTCPATGVPTGATQVKSGIAVLTYQDTTVQPGSYCYYATATLNGAESGPSNTALAQVPVGAPSALSITLTK